MRAPLPHVPFLKRLSAIAVICPTCMFARMCALLHVQYKYS